MLPGAVSRAKARQLSTLPLCCHADTIVHQSSPSLIILIYSVLNMTTQRVHPTESDKGSIVVKDCLTLHAATSEIVNWPPYSAGVRLDSPLVCGILMQENKSMMPWLVHYERDDDRRGLVAEASADCGCHCVC